MMHKYNTIHHHLYFNIIHITSNIEPNFGKIYLVYYTIIINHFVAYTTEL